MMERVEYHLPSYDSICVDEYIVDTESKMILTERLWLNIQNIFEPIHQYTWLVCRKGYENER